jgi:hypothetical protein
MRFHRTALLGWRAGILACRKDNHHCTVVLLWCVAMHAELTTTMKELGDLLTAEEISTFVSIMDKNADGVVGVSLVKAAPLWLDTAVSDSAATNDVNNRNSCTAVAPVGCLGRVRGHELAVGQVECRVTGGTN